MDKCRHSNHLMSMKTMQKENEKKLRERTATEYEEEEGGNSDVSWLFSFSSVFLICDY